ncbi:MAG: HEAT repeat domain-containing protein [Myxococcota bacterium]
MTRRRAGAALAIVALAAGFAWWLRGEEPRSDDAAHPGTASVRWPKGLVRSYRFTVAGKSQVPMPESDGAWTGDVQASGELELRGYGEKDGRTQLGLRLTKLGTATMTLLGAPALRDRAQVEAALVGPEAVVTLLPTGDVHSVAAPKDASAVFASLVQTLMGEVQWPLRPAPSWTLLEVTPRGRCETAFTRAGTELAKQRLRYATLTGFGLGVGSVRVAARAKLTLNDDGQLIAATTSERLDGATADGRPAFNELAVTLEPLGTGTFEGLPPSVAEAVALDAMKPPIDADEQLLMQRVAGLTEAQLFDGVATYGASGFIPDVGLFVARASGLLKQRPELCEKLAERAATTAASQKERDFALELLAAAGSTEAQAAMRTILSSEVVKGDPQRRDRFLRLSLLKEPTPATVAFVSSERDAATGQDRNTLSLVLGSTAGELARTSPEAAQPFLTQLTHELQSARDVTERRHLLHALGNAGQASAVDDVLRWASDPDPKVRYAAVDALRFTPTPAARAAVTQAVADADVRVATHAIELLGHWQPDAAERAAIITAFRAGRLPWRTAHGVVTALAPYADDAQVRAFFEWVLTQPAADPSVHRRIASVLPGGVTQ